MQDGETRIEMPRIFLTAALGVSTCCFLAVAVKSDEISARAKKLHFSSIVVDTHDDTTQRFLDGKFDLGTRSATGSIDREAAEKHLTKGADVPNSQPANLSRAATTSTSKGIATTP